MDDHLSSGRGVSRHRRNTNFSKERQATKEVGQKALSTLKSSPAKSLEKACR